MADALNRDGFVRPRYDDGTFDEPLLLADRFDEWIEHRAPGRLVLLGGRGSGLTTTLRWLGARLHRAELGLRAVFADDVGPADWGELWGGSAVLFVDLSVWGEASLRARQERLDAIASARVPRLVVAAHGWDDLWFGSSDSADDVVAHLAPWDPDDLLELLGSSEAYRPHRERVHRVLRGLPEAASLLRRPWTARRLVDAVVRDGCDAGTTLSGLYAALLDGLRPGTLAVLRALPPGACDTRSVFEALQAAQPPGEDGRELADLFQVSGLLAEALDRGHVHAHLMCWSTAKLAFPGLHHFLQAGDCLRQVAQGRVPEVLERPWLSYVAELITPGAREVMRGWLAGPRRAGIGDRVAVSALWACGELPPFPQHRALKGEGAFLDGLYAPSAQLVRADLSEASLREATLDDACLENGSFLATDLTGASLRRANLSRTAMGQACLGGADLSDAVLRLAHLWRADFSGACLAGATLVKARLRDTNLGRVDLAGADLTEATLERCVMKGADLSGADLTLCRCTELDLSELAGLSPARAYLSSFEGCRWVAATLDHLDLRGASLRGCDLTDVSLREASLSGATFRDCAMHGVACDGADLRGVSFTRVRFQAGSSREGLLTGKAALEGNMTGYYVEGASDDAWTRPESIAQASFRGADLRGARFESTNLFRVDLRGAHMDPDLCAQALAHGAILDEETRRRAASS
jgi:uncharacterized protein YjbI with pentapeptide repeats